MSGGVRNLRAMFENKTGDTSNSPPSRGRSPSNSVASSHSRPVSKVRASFVAVERSGEQGQLWGLRKASDVSSMADASKENESSVVDGPPLSMSKSTPEKSPGDGLGSILKGSSFVATPSKELPNKMEFLPEKSKGPLTATTANEQKQPQTNGIGARAADAAKKIQDKAKTAVKPNPQPIETTASSDKSPKKSPKTPTSAGLKPRGGVAKIQGVADSAKKAAEGREYTKKATQTNSAQSPTTPRSPAKSSTRKDQPRAAAASAPKSPAKPTSAPKSPAKSIKAPSAATAATEASAAHNRPNKVEITKKPAVHSDRPVKLPSAATATTAAYASHHEAPKVETTKKPAHSDRPVKLPSAVTATTAASAAHERSSIDTEPKKPAPRRQSAVTGTKPRLSTLGTQASLAKKASRASLADRPKSRASLAKPDDGFLARMMRPTQASSQKTHDKVQIDSPPRGKAAAPTSTKPIPRPSLNSQAHHDRANGQKARSEKLPITPVTPTSPKQARIVHQTPGSKKIETPKNGKTATGHHHHDHVDADGDYSKPPRSPVAAKHVKPASPEKAQSSEPAKDSTSRGRAHNDHIDVAGTYAEKGPNYVDASKNIEHETVQEPVEEGASSPVNGMDTPGTTNGAEAKAQETTPLPLTEPEPLSETKGEAQIPPPRSPLAEPVTEQAVTASESKTEVPSTSTRPAEPSTEAGSTTVETPERRKPRKLGPSKKNSVSNVQFEANVPRAQSSDQQAVLPKAEVPTTGEQESETQPVSSLLGIRGND
ncbi:uncharacterized protein AB675_274 [Cyphellophora attinorum]|uniref:Uncharacterized protein n=1 Tax=Cyphellophora attinorum TaxID=1664694 RepID=A0A0N0NS94_9EURO|nr:uncharacterized protein AB675_274 [Phialophora attinorum]KPI45991.1 hypothetical protein AB675_274 [Phialophora attinorum]